MSWIHARRDVWADEAAMMSEFSEETADAAGAELPGSQPPFASSPVFAAPPPVYDAPPAAPPPVPAYVPPAPAPNYVPPAPPQPRLRDRIIERIPIINRFHEPNPYG